MKLDREIVLATEEQFQSLPADDDQLLGWLRPVFNEMANAAGWTQSPIRITTA
jgi:hypothetical protein